jgi:uncharacterized membrane protein
MGFFTDFWIISIFLGPGLAISYGLENPFFNPAAHLLGLIIVQTASIAAMYMILHVLPTNVRFSNKVLEKVMKQAHDTKDDVIHVLHNATGLFKKNFGDLGFYMALAFISFAYGVYIASIVAYLLKVRLKRAMISIATGGAFAVVFWYFLALGYIPFITPVTVFITVTAISAAFMVYGEIREKRVIRNMAALVIKRRKEIQDKGIEIQDGLGTNLKKARVELEKQHKKGQKQAKEFLKKSRDITDRVTEHLSQQEQQDNQARSSQGPRD